MKKSLLALAVLSAFAGSAFAQASSVTIFGKIDAAVGKPIGTKDKRVIDGATDSAGTGGSRIGFRGYEDLGGGLGAVFAFEHRFNVDEGTAAANVPFWNGFSFVGLRSATLGTLTIGRHYTSSFLGVQNQIDPFAGETIAGLRGIYAGIGRAASVRVENSVKYDGLFGGVAVSASVAEKTSGSTLPGGVVGGGSAIPTGALPATERPVAVSLSYTGGPVWAGVAYERTTFGNKIVNTGLRYKIGTFTAAAGVSDGETTSGADYRGYLLGGTVGVGSGDIKFGWAKGKVASTVFASKVSLGYHHNLSKRTKLYADVARDSKVLTPVGDPEKLGYDVGIQHNF
jgi:predicted porin